MAGRRGFGAIRRLPSKRYQAHYVGPDTVKHYAPVTYQTREDAEAWLAARRSEIRSQDWTPPRVGKPLTFGEHAERWLKNRKLKPRTRYHYQGLLDGKILPTFRDVPLKHVTADLVDDWYYRLGDGTPTARAHSYGLLRTILGDAVQRRLLDFQPLSRQRGRQLEAREEDSTRHPARARGPHPGHARAVPAHGAARRMVRSAVRGADRAAPW